MSPFGAPPPHDQPDAKESLLAQFAKEKAYVEPGKDGTIDIRSPYAMTAMGIGGPLRIPRKDDPQYEGSMPPPSYSSATGQPEQRTGTRVSKRKNALGKEIDSGGISGWWERRKERKAEEKANRESIR